MQLSSSALALRRASGAAASAARASSSAPQQQQLQQWRATMPRRAPSVAAAVSTRSSPSTLRGKHFPSRILVASATEGDSTEDAEGLTLATSLAPVAESDSEEDSDDDGPSAVQRFLYPEQKELPDDFAMPIWDHLDELRERVLLAALAAAFAVAGCFAFSKDLVVFLEAPVADQGVRFLQLSPGEFFFTTLKVAGYAGLLLATPTVLYEVVAYVVPGLTRSERKLLAPIVFGSGLLFYAGLVFSYEVLAPAALTFFVSYADGAVESLWSIDQYFEFVLVLMLSTGLAFQVPVIQLLLGQAGLVTSRAMLSQWRWVVVGATVAAAVLTPSTDPFTQTLLAVPLVGLYMGGALGVKAIEAGREKEGAALS